MLRSGPRVKDFGHLDVFKTEASFCMVSQKNCLFRLLYGLVIQVLMFSLASPESAGFSTSESCLRQIKAFEYELAVNACLRRADALDCFFLLCFRSREQLIGHYGAECKWCHLPHDGAV